MPKVTTNQTNFSSGEISPLAMGRSDISKFANSAKIMENFLINQLGGGVYRPGTKYIADARYTDKKCRLMPFQYSADQDYIMELGDLYLRMFSNDSSAVSISTQIEYVDDANTLVLLNFNADPFVDSSSNSIAITNDGVTADTTTKKLGASSGLFASSKHLALADDAIFDIETGDFTIEYDVYYTSKVYHWDVDFGYAGAAGISIWVDNADNSLNYKVGGTTYDGGYVPPINEWLNIALVRESGVVKLFVNGVQRGSDQSIATDLDMSSTKKWIGEYNAGSNGLVGNMDNFRFSDSARYDDTYTPGNFSSVSEITTTYEEADLFEIMQAHKNDVKYLVHADYPPRKISRTSATAFSIDDVTFVRGPFRDDNTTATTINPSSATGSTTLTASEALFDDPDHVGSLWRVKDGVVLITAVNSTTEAEGTVQAEPDGTAGDLGGTSAVTDWAEGAFSAYRGYPTAVSFHDGRLWYGKDQYIYGSVLYSYDNFNEDDASDDDAVTFEIASEERIAIQWLMSGRKSLSIGTSGGTFSASGSSDVSITPSDIQIARDTNYGAALLAPKRISSFIYYTQRNLNKVREISYNYDIDSQTANDMNLLAEHILRDGDGVVDLDQQQSPNDRIWCVRDDGEMAVMTRNPEQEVMGWCRVVAGVDSTSAGEFESVCVIPKQDADDQVWVVVKRTIDGTTKRFIEYFTPEIFDEDWDAIRLDSSVTLDSPVTITGATSADPVVVTAASHGFSNGDYVQIDGVVGMTELNGNTYKVASKTDDTFELTDTDDADIDGSAYTTYISGGEVREKVTAISGLDHLDGEDVYVQADGVALDDTYEVSSGAITLDSRAAVVHVGLKYNGTIQLLKLSDGSAIGTGQTKNRRIYQIVMRVDRSLSMKVGKSEDTLDVVYFGYANDTTVTDLFTGDLKKFFQTWWAEDDEILIRQDKPNPLHVLCLVISSEVEG